MIVESPDFMEWVEVGEDGLYVIDGAPEGTERKLKEWLERVEEEREQNMPKVDDQKCTKSSFWKE